VKITAHALLGTELAAPGELQQPGQARRARVAHVDPGRRARQVVRLLELLLGHQNRRAVGREHAAHDRRPVVGLVVEDPLRHAVRLLLPRPHDL
jgi:hypothetical protein